ncbi:HGxxPAAW family protein [Streptomyces sp. YIM 98790]|uniref:HGxxPAAW family protein n=1 Tax=Streptomyces sp. YIM 98790 TaxID=2689077 RepID=UPI001A9CD8A3|nr:HGxxPAAW family protein [Streptomyces sp. YIM 98790]
MAGNGHDHGNNPAAWTGVFIALIGFSLGGVFTIMAEPLLVAASAAVVALGGVVTLVMRSMGLGAQNAAGSRSAGAASSVTQAGSATATGGTGTSAGTGPAETAAA